MHNINEEKAILDSMITKTLNPDKVKHLENYYVNLSNPNLKRHFERSVRLALTSIESRLTGMPEPACTAHQFSGWEKVSEILISNPGDFYVRRCASCSFSERLSALTYPHIENEYLAQQTTE